MIPERFDKLSDDWELFKKKMEVESRNAPVALSEESAPSLVAAASTGWAAQRAFDEVRRDVAERLEILRKADDGHEANHLQTDELKFVLARFDEAARWHSLPNKADMPSGKE